MTMNAARFNLRFALGALLAWCFCANAEIRLVDDSGKVVVLGQPAQRIVSLAPHLTELVYAAGAGGRIVGTVEYSDHPQEAQKIARVGNYAQLDLERIVSLKPDLVLVWLHGNGQRQLDKLLKLGIPVFYNQSYRFGDIWRSIEQFGRLAGTEAVAEPAARALAAREVQLRTRYTGRATVRVFYQIAQKPLMTINGDHLISDMIRLCGGRNVFAELKPLVPVISTEAVLEADPEAIGSAFTVSRGQNGLEHWKKWPRLTATARNNFFLIPADHISRLSPRILDGTRQICEDLDAVRARRPKGRP